MTFACSRDDSYGPCALCGTRMRRRDARRRPIFLGEASALRLSEESGVELAIGSGVCRSCSRVPRTQPRDPLDFDWLTKQEEKHQGKVQLAVSHDQSSSSAGAQPPQYVQLTLAQQRRHERLLAAIVKDFEGRMVEQKRWVSTEGRANAYGPGHHVTMCLGWAFRRSLGYGFTRHTPANPELMALLYQLADRTACPRPARFR